MKAIIIISALALLFTPLSAPALEIDPDLDYSNPLAVSDEVERLIAVGENSLALGKYSSAREAFELALTLQGKNFTALVGLGEALVGMESLAQALEIYNSALKIDSSDSSVWQKYADMVEKIGDAKQKEKAYSSWAKKAKSDSRPRFKLLEIYQAQEDNSKIIDIAKELVGLGEYSCELFLTLGKAYLATGKDDKALDAFNRAVGEDPGNLEPHLELGRLYLSKGLYQEATAEFKDVLSIDPTSIEAHYRMGVAYVRLGESYEAIYELEKVCSPAVEYKAIEELGDEYPRALEELGTLYFHQGRAKDAVDILLKVRDLDGSTTQSELILGQALKSMNRDSKAIEAFRNSIALDRKNGSAHLGLGELHLDREEYAEAINSLEQAEDTLKDNFQVHHLLAMAYLGNGGISSAEKHFLKALGLDASRMEPYVELGKIYTLQEKFPKAIQQFNGALNIAPSDPEVLFLLAEVYRLSGEPESAIEYYHKCLFIKEDFPEAHNSLGEVFFTLEDYSEAVVEFELATRYDPNFALAFFNVGKTDEVMGYYDQAISAYDHAYQIDSSLVKALLGKGRTLYLKGELEGAEQALKDVAKKDTANYEAYYYLGRIYDELQDFSKSAGEYGKSAELNPDHSDSFLRWGLALLRDMKDEEAVAPLKQAVKQLPDSVPAHAYLAVAYENIGELKKAIGEYKTLAKLEPDNPEHQKDVAYLERESGNTGGAIDALYKAIELDPDDPMLYLSRGDLYRVKAYDVKKLARYNEELEWLEKAATDYEEFLALAPSNEKAALIAKFLDGYSRYKFLPLEERRRVEVFPLPW